MKINIITAAMTAVSVMAPAVSRATLPSSGTYTPGAVYSLDSCRTLALTNNKQLQIAGERVRAAEYRTKEAFAAYLPGLDLVAGYMYNQKNVNLLHPSDFLSPINPGVLQGIVQKYPFLGELMQQNPQLEQLAGEALKGANEVVGSANNLLHKSTSFDIHNVFGGAVTLTQPLFMGGKIKAMNDLTGYGREVARALRRSEAEEVVYNVDAAYWLVVSLRAKRDLAVSYVNLLDSLDRNVGKMVEQGVATRSDKLNVDVKLNSAKVDLTKVENGLTLSRMALAQICGLPLDSDMHLSDEADGNGLIGAEVADSGAEITRDVLNDTYARRPDLQALESGVKAAGAQARVARSSMLPTVALTGMYSLTNPNSFNGFENKFGGAFSVGVVARIPLWHWGGNYYKYKAARADEAVMRIRLSDARELVDLQVNQASFKARETLKVYATTRSNLDAANENLRCATVGFREGVITTDDVLGAQTAWLKANSENVDAMIDVRLCDVYLQKVLGTLQYDIPETNN